MIRLLKFWQTLGLATALLSLAGTERANATPYSIDILIDPNHPGIVDSWLFNINNLGQSTGYVVDHVGSSFIQSAIAYQNGNTQVLATGGAGSFALAGFALNNLGEVVGNIGDAPHFFGGGPPVPIEVPDKFVSLFVAGLLPGGLNDSGNVLIGAYPNEPISTPTGAFSGLALWNQGVAEPLSTLDALYPFVNPPDINDFNSGPSSGVYTASVTGLNNASQFAAGLHYSDFDPGDPNNSDDDVFNDYFTQAYIYNSTLR